MKCSTCNKEIEETFLKKIIGTYVGSGKAKRAVCASCQKAGSRAAPQAKAKKK